MEDYYNGIKGIYFNRVLGKVIKLGNLSNEDGLILDFGCGLQKLKKKLTTKQVIGYDIVPRLSEVDDWKKLSPSTIVCNHVLEHLTEKELKGVLDKFIEKKSKLIVSLPTENKLSKIGISLIGKDYHKEHKLTYKQVNRIIEQRYKIIKRKYVFTMTQITLYERK